MSKKQIKNNLMTQTIDVQTAHNDYNNSNFSTELTTGQIKLIYYNYVMGYINKNGYYLINRPPFLPKIPEGLNHNIQ